LIKRRRVDRKYGGAVNWTTADMRMGGAAAVRPLPPSHDGSFPQDEPRNYFMPYKKFMARRCRRASGVNFIAA
jgi:hypothetical protein